MAKGKGEVKGWITRHGVHVPIYSEYTVRGGTEPKAKGSRFKSNKRSKKPDREEVSKSNHENMLAVKERIREKEAMEERKAKYLAENSATEGESEASKGKQVEGKGAVKDVQGKKSEDRDYNELAGAHKAGYSAQSEEGKPSVDFSKMKYSEAGAYVAAHKKDFGLNDDDDAYQAAYEMKQGTWKGKMPGQESSSKYDKVSPGGASEWRNFSDAQVMDYAKDDHYRESATIEMQRRGLGITDQKQYYDSQKSSTPAQDSFSASMNERSRLRGKIGAEKKAKEQESSTPDFSKMSYSEAGKHVAANKARYGLKDEDDAYLAAAQMKNGTWKGGSTAQENRRWADDMNKKTMRDTSSSNTESNAGNRYGNRQTESSTSKSQDSLSASMNRHAQIRAQISDTNKARSGNFNSMTVSGLKQAFASASAAEKAKIRAALQAKGYAYRGGKWVKK